MKIPIAFATDQNYVFYTCVAIESLAQKASLDTEYQIYILTGQEYLDENLFESLEQKYPHIRIKIIRVEEEQFRKVIINNSHVTKTTFYRLLLCSLLDEEKCIYLDSDIIVREDLQSLFSVNMAEYYIAGCRDIWIDMLSKEECENRRRRTDIPSMHDYVNAGVLIMNLQKIRTDGLEEEFLKHLTIDYLYEDQDIINVCCYGKILCLPPKWNLFTVFLGLTEQMRASGISDTIINEYKEKGGILHYATPPMRPWEHFYFWANKEWWDIAAEWKEEPYYQKLKEKIQKRDKKEHWIYYLEKCKEYEKIVVFGFTFYGKLVCDWLLNSGYRKKLLFCDNNPEKKMQRYKGIEVFALEEIKGKKTLFINSCQRRQKEVIEMLLESGIKEDDILCYRQKEGADYLYLDRQYYLEELKDIFLRERGEALCGFEDDLEKMQKILIEKTEYRDWHERYCMKNWILKGVS